MPTTRDDVFARVTVDYLVRGGGRVAWTLRSTFREPAPHSFQLEARREGGLDWVAVGVPVIDAFSAVDTEKRLYGTDRRLEYRVVLTTPVGSYPSPVARPLGLLDKRAWGVAREIIRSSLAGSRQRGLATVRGHLLKRKAHGTACTNCLDPTTGLVLQSDCPVCNGTQFVAGYWRAVEHSMLDLSPAKDARQVDGETGTDDPDLSRIGQFVGPLIPEPKDVWVSAGDDRRYAVGSVHVRGELAGVPLIVDAELREIPHSDPAYALTV